MSRASTPNLEEVPVMPDNDAIVALAAAINVYQGLCAGALIMAVCAALAAVVKFL